MVGVMRKRKSDWESVNVNNKSEVRSKVTAEVMCQPSITMEPLRYLSELSKVTTFESTSFCNSLDATILSLLHNVLELESGCCDLSEESVVALE
jgi:hypothetical protein